MSERHGLSEEELDRPEEARRVALYARGWGRTRQCPLQPWVWWHPAHLGYHTAAEAERLEGLAS